MNTTPAETQSAFLKLVVIGNGMAGAKLLEELIDTCPERYQITVFGNEPYGNYNRIMLSPVLAGDKTISEIMINGKEWYQANNIELCAGPDKAIVKIDRAGKKVIAADGSETPYDRLVIATGSRPFMMPVPGIDLKGVMSFRDIADVENMVAAADRYKRAVVIGAGLLGLEAAVGLTTRGMDVTVVHSNVRPLNRQLDDESGQMLRDELESRGLSFKMSARTAEILEGERNGEGHVSKVLFSDGSELEADLVIMAIGIRPNADLAIDAGIYCENGIVVDDTLQTYDPSIYALGECIQHRGETFGLVAPLYDQAKVLTNHLSGHGVARYETLPTATKLKVTGINLFSVGEFEGDETTDAIIYRDKSQAVYKKLVLRNNQLVGAVLYGDVQEGAFYNELLDSKEKLTELRPYMMFGRALCEEMFPEKFSVQLEGSELAQEIKS